jgi:hypothetical protein
MTSSMTTFMPSYMKMQQLDETLLGGGGISKTGMIGSTAENVVRYGVRKQTRNHSSISLAMKTK